MNTRNIVLDTCVLVQLSKDHKEVVRFKKMLKGKNVTFIIPDVVVQELYYVAQITKSEIPKLLSYFGKKIFFDSVKPHKTSALQISSQFHDSHFSDSQILALCQAKDYILITFDKALLRVSNMINAVAFHPKYSGDL